MDGYHSSTLEMVPYKAALTPMIFQDLHQRAS